MGPAVVTFYSVVFLPDRTQPPPALNGSGFENFLQNYTTASCASDPQSPSVQGRGQLWLCPVGVPTWASAPGLSRGPFTEGWEGRGASTCTGHSLPAGWPGRGGGGEHGRKSTEPPPPSFSAMPRELAPLSCNCHLQDFNGQPAVCGSGRGLNCPPRGQVGLWGSWVGAVLGGQESFRCEQCCRGSLFQLVGVGTQRSTQAAATWSRPSGLCRPGNCLCQMVPLMYPPPHTHF